MKIRNIAIRFCYMNNNSIRINCSIFAIGIILLGLGIQGLYNIFDNKNFTFSNIEVYSYLLLCIGIIMILISIISCNFKPEYDALFDSNN